jgi:hypothetical protein
MNELILLGLCDNLPEATKNRLRKALNLTRPWKSKKKYKCLHMGCRSPSCDSHELSEKSILKFISSQDSVLMLREEFENNPLKLKIKEVRTKEATAFPGFCSEHDRDLFLDLDKEFFVEKTHVYKQCYKSIRKELHHQTMAYHTLTGALREMRCGEATSFREDPEIRHIRLKRHEQRTKVKNLAQTINALFSELKSPDDLTFEKFDLQGSFFALSVALDLSKPTDENQADFLFFLQIIPKTHSSSLIIAHKNSQAAKKNLGDFINFAGGMAYFVNEIIYTNRDRIAYSAAYIESLAPPELQSMLAPQNPNSTPDFILPSTWKFINRSGNA